MIAHEVRNLLTPVRIVAQSALDGVDDVKELKAALRRALQTCEQIATITDALLSPGSAQRSPQSLSAIMQETASFYQYRDDAQSAVHIEIPDGLMIDTNADVVRHILLNLISNSLRAANRQPNSVRVFASCSTGNTRVGCASDIEIVVEDDGSGFTQSVLDQINQKPQGESGVDFSEMEFHADRRGVGLEVTRRLARTIGANIVACNTPGGGARVVVTLPQLRSNLADAA